jgi:psiF repeat
VTSINKPRARVTAKTLRHKSRGLIHTSYLFRSEIFLTFKGKRMKTSLKTLLITGGAALTLFAASAQAQTTRASCEADAKAQNIVGADRVDFMKACLPAGMSADEPAKKATATKAKSTKATKGKKAKTKKPMAKTKKAASAKVAPK